MNQEEAIAAIKKMLTAENEEELQKLIGIYLPQMDSTFFAVLTEAAEVESKRNPAVGARLESLAQTLLPLRTLI
jgi:hypothetical protein